MIISRDLSCESCCASMQFGGVIIVSIYRSERLRIMQPTGWWLGAKVSSISMHLRVDLSSIVPYQVRLSIGSFTTYLAVEECLHYFPEGEGAEQYQAVAETTDER